MTQLDPAIEKLLGDATQALRAALGADLVRVVLFGSRARGTAAPEADVDLLVVLRERTPQLEDLVSVALYGVMWRHDFTCLLSPVILDESEYRLMLSRGFSFIRNVEQEGVVLWTRAA